MKKKILAVVFVVGIWVVIPILAVYYYHHSYPKYEKQEGGLGRYIAISPDDSEILFSWYKGDTASLYAADVNGCNVRRVTKARRESHVGGSYSYDGSKILFLAYREKQGNPYSTLCVMDANGANIQRLTSGKEHITEAIFSPDGNTIYYLQSNSFGRDSPREKRSPHEIDIYSIDVDGTDCRRLTNRKEYWLYGLCITGNGRLLGFGKYDHKEIYPFYILDLESADVALQSLSPLGQFHLYFEKINGLNLRRIRASDLQFSPDGNSAAFVAAAPMPKGPLQLSDIKDRYELYLMDVESKRSEKLTELRRLVRSPRFMRNLPRIIFIVDAAWPNREEERYELWAVNTDGTELSEIKLSMGK